MTEAAIGTALLFTLPTCVITAIITDEWRYLIGALACWLLLREK